MAGISSIGALASMSEEDLYYQYLINNNSTSTMLNAVIGNGSDSDSSALTGVVNSLSGGTLTGIDSLLGGTVGNLGSVNTLTSFSEILKTYMGTQNQEASKMAEKLADTLKEAEAAGEKDTHSYKTVQEIYQYFLEKTSAESAAAGQGSQSSDNGKAVVGSIATAQPASFDEVDEFDFDSFEEESEQWIASLPGASFEF